MLWRRSQEVGREGDGGDFVKIYGIHEEGTGTEMDDEHVASNWYGTFILQKMNMLTPIDVLMVWHAFMLNPRNYLEDCVRFGLKDLWATGLPWPAVNAAIDTSFNYEVPDEGKKAWTAKTGRHWTNALDSLVKNLQCPRCNQQLEIPWTTCSQGEKPSMSE